MTRARLGKRKARGCDAINRGVGHKITRPSGKKLAGKRTNIRPFGVLPPSPKRPALSTPSPRGSPVKPADRVAMATTSPTNTGANGADVSENRFFRSRYCNRKATVSISKGLKYELTSSGLVRSAAAKRLGPYKSLPATPRAKCAFTGASATRRDLLTAIDELDRLDSTPSPQPVTPTKPSTPDTPATPCALRLVLDESDGELATPRRSPRKHQRPPAGGDTTPLRRGFGTDSTSARRQAAGSAEAPLRRSPRKTVRPPMVTGVPTHAENEGPTRVSLAPRRSPRKHQHPLLQATGGASPAASTAGAVYDRLEEQLMRMEAGEDKENEAPDRRKKTEDARFYSIFYRKPGGDAPPPTASLKGKSPRPPPAGSEGKRTTRAAAARPDAQPGLEQLVIDAGQRVFGVITCSACSLVYTVGDPEDEALHARHHTGYLSALLFPGWKHEHEVGHYIDGRVVMVTPRDPAHAWRKVDSVLGMVDAELGFVGVGVRNRAQSKVFFYVLARQIAGCLVAEPVSRGFRVLPAGAAPDRAAVSCDTTPQPCVVGVSRVWVRRDHRRRQLATRMVEAMRNHFAMSPLRWRDVAFSDPTPDGLKFAAAVTGSHEFLVYNQ